MQQDGCNLLQRRMTAAIHVRIVNTDPQSLQISKFIMVTDVMASVCSVRKNL